MKTGILKSAAILILALFLVISLTSCESMKGAIASLEEKTTAGGDKPIDTSWKDGNKQSASGTQEDSGSSATTAYASEGTQAPADKPFTGNFNVALAQLTRGVAANSYASAIERMQSDYNLNVVVLTGDESIVRETSELLRKPSYKLKDSYAIVFNGKIASDKTDYIVFDNGILVSGLYLKPYLDPSKPFDQQVFYAKWDRIDTIFDQIPRLSSSGCSKIILPASINEPPAEADAVWVLDSTVASLGYLDNWRLKNGQSGGETYITDNFSARFDYIYSKGITPKSVQLFALSDSGTAVKTNAVIASY